MTRQMGQAFGVCVRGLAGVGLFLATGCATLEEPALRGEDAALRAAIVQRLALDSMTRDNLYRVVVSGDQVSLSGTVRSEVERMRVLGLVRGTPGVGNVSDRLRLIP